MWAKIARFLGLLPKEPPDDAKLQGVLTDAERTHMKLWRLTNESRIRRGKPPLPPPSWDSMLGVRNQGK